MPPGKDLSSIRQRAKAGYLNQLPIATKNINGPTLDSINTTVNGGEKELEVLLLINSVVSFFLLQ